MSTTQYKSSQVRAIKPATATHDCTCLDHLGRRDTDRIISTLHRAAQSGKGKYSGDWHVSLSQAVSPGNTEGGSITEQLTSCLTCLD